MLLQSFIGFFELGFLFAATGLASGLFGIELIGWPSRGDVLSDLETSTAGSAGDLHKTLAGWCGEDRDRAGASSAPDRGSAGAKLLTIVLGCAAKLFTAGAGDEEGLVGAFLRRP